MTLLAPSTIYKAYGVSKVTSPIWQNPNLCHTAEMADGANTGSIMQGGQSHFLHYRVGGPCHWSIIETGTEPGTLYLIIHYPERRDTSTQNFIVWMRIRGAGTIPWNVKWRDNFGAGAWTDIWSGTADTTSTDTKAAVIAVDPPSGTGANSVKVIEFYYEDCVPCEISMYPVGDKTTPAAQHVVPVGGCSAGRYITEATNSYKGLVTSIGTGADDVESLERLTRRTFFNGCHPEGSYITTATSQKTWRNMFTEFKFTARCVDLLGDSADHYCYPCAVVTATNHTQEGGVVYVKYSNAALDSWIYTFQAGDADGTPIFINPWRTGSSSASGLPVKTSANDEITITGYVEKPDQGDDVTLHLLAWALFEGPRY